MNVTLGKPQRGIIQVPEMLPGVLQCTEQRPHPTQERQDSKRQQGCWWDACFHNGSESDKVRVPGTYKRFTPQLTFQDQSRPVVGVQPGDAMGAVSRACGC